MEKNYSLFDYNKILDAIKNKETPRVKKLVDGIASDSKIEDLALYKDYLLKYDLERVFDGYAFSAQKPSITKDDLLLLFRLICDSNKNTFKILYDKEHNAIDFQIITITEESVTRNNVKNLSDSEIFNLYYNYIRDLFIRELKQPVFDIDNDILESYHKTHLTRYMEKVRIWHDLMESEKILSEMDELLNSECI